MSRILCPIDLSPAGERVARHAIGLAARLGDGVHLLHVWESPLFAMAEAEVALPPEFESQYLASLRNRFDAALAALATEGVALDGELAEGEPAEVINEVAGRIGAELIVMGTHGRRGLAHLLIGSVAEQVVRTATVPVLTLRTSD